jgi:hypothetical protein
MMFALRAGADATAGSTAVAVAAADGNVSAWSGTAG